MRPMARRSVFATFAVLAIAAVITAWRIRLATETTRAETPPVDQRLDGLGRRPVSRDSRTTSEKDPSSNVAEPADDDARRRSTPASDPSLKPSILRVQVVDRVSRRPRAGVRVVLTPPPISYTGFVPQARGTEFESILDFPITNAEGRVEFECAPNVSYALIATGTDESDEASLDVGSIAEGGTRELVCEIGAPPDSVRFVRVLERETRRPIPSLAVHVEQGMRTPEIVAHGTTDADGWCRIELRADRRQHCVVDVAPFARAVAPLDETNASRETAVELLLSRGATLRGRLTGARGGMIVLRTAGRASLTPELASRADEVPREGSWSSPVSEDGSFSFGSLVPDCAFAAEFRATAASSPRILERVVALRAGEERDVMWHLPTAGTVRGRLIDDHDAPVANVEVWVVSDTQDAPYVFAYGAPRSVFASATSGEDGAFEMNDISFGEWLVGIAAPSAESLLSGKDDGFTRPERVIVSEQGQVRDVVLRVEPGLFIDGRVTTPTGEIVDGGVVQAMQLEGAFAVTAVCHGGAFRIGPMPRGRYRVTLHSTRLQSLDGVVADAGARDVVLETQPTATLVARLVDARGGDSVCELRVCGRDRRESDFPVWSFDADESGAFRVDTLSPGTYDVIALHSDGRCGVVRDVRVTPEAPSNDVEVRLTPAGRLRIRTSETRGRLLVWSERALFASIDADGAPADLGLPPGDARVELGRMVVRDGRWRFESLATETLTVTAGETHVVTIDPPR